MWVYIDLNQEPAHYNKRMIFQNIYDLLDFITLFLFPPAISLVMSFQ